jgi:hypothetical protein
VSIADGVLGTFIGADLLHLKDIQILVNTLNSERKYLKVYCSWDLQEQVRPYWQKRSEKTTSPVEVRPESTASVVLLRTK